MNAVLDKEVVLKHDEIDTVGELLNISMGAAATAISVLLNKQVNITTPVVKVVDMKDFSYTQLEPAIGVEINYTEGLHGTNLMIMSLKDINIIVDSLMGDTSGISKDEIDEIQKSILGEIMNQMMGSASTALASFFNKSINISPPRISNPFDLYEGIYKNSEASNIVTVSFKFFVEDLVDNNFMTVFSPSLARELALSAMNLGEEEIISNYFKDNDDESQISGHQQIPETIYADEPEVAVKQPQKSVRNEIKHQNKSVSMENNRMNDRAMSKVKNKPEVNVKKLTFESFDEPKESSNNDDKNVNLDLVMDVELNVRVEIGHVNKPVKDIINLSRGSIIELNKQAGEPVDIIINDQLIARGDVVVIDDNFGVRITEVINSGDKK